VLGEVNQNTAKALAEDAQTGNRGSARGEGMRLLVQEGSPSDRV
jgi:hypothetical protein